MNTTSSNNNPIEQQPEVKTYRQAMKDFWSGVDWSKTNLMLSIELGVATTTVYKWRLAMTGDGVKHKPAKKHNIDWDSLDWSKNDSTLARELHIPYPDIRRVRIKLNKPYPTRDSYHRKIDQEKLAAIDWELTRDVDIGIQLGVSRERARQLRNDLQKPACLVAHMGKNRIECFKWVIKNRSTLEGKSRREISDLFNKEYPSLLFRPEIYHVISKTKIKTKIEREYNEESEHLYEKVNFRLPNIVLKMVYGIPNHRISTARDRLFKGKSIWHLGGYSNLINDPEFISELEAEKVKAEELGFTVDSARIDKWLEWKRGYRHPHLNK